MRMIFTAAALAALVPAAADLLADEHAPDDGLHIREWPVEWQNTRPRDPSVTADGKVWFVGQSGHYAARFDPETETFERFDLPDGAGPHTIYVTDDQEVWYAGNRDAHLGRIDPETGEITRVEMPDELKDPHTIVEDGQGRLWFTSQWANHVGRYDRESGEIVHVAVPTENARPYGIDVAEDGTVWVVLLGTNGLAKIDPETLALEQIDLPRDDARLRRIAITDRGVWYSDYARGFIGVHDPATGAFDEWRTDLEHRAGPYALIADGQGRIWYVETHPEPNRFVGFDPATETFIANEPVPSGGGAVRHMVFDAERNAIWFGTDTNKLGRADLPE